LKFAGFWNDVYAEIDDIEKQIESARQSQMKPTSQKAQPEQNETNSNLLA
jgi:hypothetical protein